MSVVGGVQTAAAAAAPPFRAARTGRAEQDVVLGKVRERRVCVWIWRTLRALDARWVRKCEWYGNLNHW